MNKPIKKVLKNGMRIVVIPMKESPTVTTLVYVNTGSRYETKEINGISHFLEHMFFKGTKKRKSSEISHELDALGSLSNAFTWYEFTGYYAKARNKNFSKITDVISDIYLNSEFPKEEIEKERGVIMAEIDMYKDSPASSVHFLLDELMYGNQPAGRSVLGSKENIKKIAREDFIKYKEKHYVAKKTVVVVAGNINPKDVFKEVEEKFKGIKTNVGGKKKKVIEKQTKPEVKLENKKTDQAHLVIGFRSNNDKSKKNNATRVLSSVLGNGMSSRLFEKLREEMGVAYYVRSSNSSYSDVGVFGISAGVDPKRINEVLNVVMKELAKLKNDLVLEKELNKAKEYLIGNMQMGVESSDSVAEWFGEFEISNLELKTPKQMADEIMKVTAKDVQKIAGEIFQNNKMNLAVIGPIKKNQDLLKYLKI
ncbi:MAG: M16 family peptidase [Parcubacteria group bacterium Athens0714_16]|nr:MAG: M16 family peptidase [Parcubacteria group bacterium Athens0714_16]